MDSEMKKFCEGAMVGLSWAITVAAIFLLALLVDNAHAHDVRYPNLDEWYGSLQRPGVRPGAGFTSCCSKTDCHTTEAELREGDWWARIGVRQADDTWQLRDWVKVPADKVLQQHDNPTGEGVICHSINWAMGEFGGHAQALDPKSTTIWCFVPPAET